MAEKGGQTQSEEQGTSQGIKRGAEQLGEGRRKSGSEGRGRKEVGQSQGRSPTGGFWEQHGQWSGQVT